MKNTYSKLEIHSLIKEFLTEKKTEEYNSDSGNYMFFSNLEQIRDQANEILQMSKNKVDRILSDGHAWAVDHISTSKDDIEEVYNFLNNRDNMPLEEGKKKSGTKLCTRGKAAAKSKFKVYPSAYANGYAVQVCKGTKPGLDGKKRCSPPYC